MVQIKALLIDDQKDDPTLTAQVERLAREVQRLEPDHTLVTMTRTLQRLEQEGHVIEKEVLGVLSPYQTEHINRFGNYTVNMNRIPEPLDFELR